MNKVIIAFDTRYVLAETPADDLQSPYSTSLDSKRLRELSKKKIDPKIQYAVFYRVYGPEAYKMLEGMKSDNQDAWQKLVDQLRKQDAWILSNEDSVSDKPIDAVKSKINVSDIRGLSAAASRTIDDAYVSGNKAYVEIAKAFVGAPPPPAPSPAGGPQPGGPAGGPG